MAEEVFDSTWFHLVSSTESSPATGIKINLEGTAGNKFYEAQSTFRFTDQTASKNANLSNLIVSSGQKDEENSENSTYKTYDLTPTFEKDTLNYEITLLEYQDNLDITAITEDSKATLKLKLPKRDENGELCYEADGTTLLYEEKELVSNTPLAVTINELGKEDTKLTIIVTAEDGRTTKQYSITIKRPYATIKGSIYTEPTASTTGKYLADILLYQTQDTQKIVNWEEAIEQDKLSKADSLHEELLTIPEVVKQKTQEDGNFEIKVIPGEYDLLINKQGYIDYIHIQITLQESQIKQLGQIELIAGDVNKDGVVEILDKVLITKQNGTNSSSADFSVECDLNDDGKVEILDKTIVTKNNGQRRKIINEKGGNT